MDVSFISATLLLEPVFAAAPSLNEAVILVKPQFEAGASTWARAASSAIRGASAGHRQSRRLRPLARLAGGRDDSIAHHRHGRQPRVSALRARA
jgi:hypothetical protein